MQHREREREREGKRRKKNKTTTKKMKKIKTQRPKKSRERATCFLTSTFCGTLYIFFFSPSLKGERKERRGRFDLHNNAQKHTEDTRAKKKAFVDKTTTRFFTETRVSLRRRTKGKRRFVESAILKKFVKRFVEERPLKRRRLDLKFSLFSLSLYILLS